MTLTFLFACVAFFLLTITPRICCNYAYYKYSTGHFIAESNLYQILESNLYQILESNLYQILESGKDTVEPQSYEPLGKRGCS